MSQHDSNGFDPYVADLSDFFEELVHNWAKSKNNYKAQISFEVPVRRHVQNTLFNTGLCVYRKEELILNSYINAYSSI